MKLYKYTVFLGLPAFAQYVLPLLKWSILQHVPTVHLTILYSFKHHLIISGQLRFCSFWTFIALSVYLGILMLCLYLVDYILNWFNFCILLKKWSLEMLSHPGMLAPSRIHAWVLSHFSHAWLYDPMDCSPPGSSVHGILLARILGGLPCPPPGDLSNPSEHICISYVSCFGRQFLYY